MNENPDELRRRIEALEQRLSQLSAAVLRVSSSLDLDTVLQEVVDSARTLTGALYGVMVTLDEAGEIDAFVTSGFTPDEEDQMAGWADGPRLFEHFHQLDSADPAGRPARLRPGARLLGRLDAFEDVAGHADATTATCTSATSS